MEAQDTMESMAPIIIAIYATWASENLNDNRSWSYQDTFKNLLNLLTIPLKLTFHEYILVLLLNFF